MWQNALRLAQRVIAVEWRNVLRLVGLVIVAIELRQVLIGEPVDQGLVLMAAGLLGVPSMFRGNGKDSH